MAKSINTNIRNFFIHKTLTWIVTLFCWNFSKFGIWLGPIEYVSLSAPREIHLDLSCERKRHGSMRREPHPTLATPCRVAPSKCISFNVTFLRRERNATRYYNWTATVKLSLCLTKHQAMKTYWGSGGIAPHILDLGTKCRWVVSFTPRSLYLQCKSPCYPLLRRLGGPQRRSGCSGEEKNSQPPPGIEP
jgi:hypothetical protein